MCVCVRQVCGSMPYDDTDVKKMIKYQTERKVGFSRHKNISSEVKQLIHGILEAKTDRRFSISDVRQSAWMTQTDDWCTTTTTTTTVGDTTTGSRELSASGQQSDSTEPAAVVETDRPVDESYHRPVISINNNNDTATKLPRLVVPTLTPTPPTGAGVAVVLRQTTGHRAGEDCGPRVVPRSARRRDDPPQPVIQTAQLWSAAFGVRDRARASGR